MPTLYTLLKFLTPLEKIFVLFIGKDIFLKNRRKVNKPQKLIANARLARKTYRHYLFNSNASLVLCTSLIKFSLTTPTRLNWEPF